MQKRDRESQQGEQPEQEEAAEAKEKSPASESPPIKKKPTAAPSAVDASDAPSAAEVPTTVADTQRSAAAAPPVSGAAAAAELPKVWFKYGETVSSVRIAVGSDGDDLIEKIVNKLHKAVTELAVSLPESLANKLQRFCLEGSAELKPRATLDTVFFRELGKQALVVTERTPSSVAVKVRLDHTVVTIEGLRLGSSTVGDLKFQAVRVLSGPHERAADYSLFFDPTQPTIVWGSAAGSADWLEKFCEGIPAASADLAAAETMRKLKGDATLDQDFFRVVKGNVEITLRQTSTAGEPKFDIYNPVTSLRRAAADDRLSRLGLVIKENVLVPTILATVAFRKFVAREEATRNLLRFFQQRMSLFSSSPSKILQQAKSNPLYAATAGAPGTGKSRLLDEVAKLGTLSPEELQRCAGDVQLSAEFVASVRGWIPINITFNSNTDFDPSLEVAHIEHYFCLRILLSYLCDRFDYSLLCNWAKPETSAMLDIDSTLNAVIADFKATHPGLPEPTIFLGVDELIKVGEANTPKITSIIKRACCHRVYSLVTTLDIALGFGHETTSGTLIFWISLKLPNAVETKALLSLDSIREDLHVEGLEALLRRAQFQALIADCNGHLRTLGVLVSAAAKLAKKSPPSLISWSLLLKESSSLSSLFDTGLTQHVLRLVLLGEYTRLDSKDPETQKEISYYIRTGVLSNTLANMGASESIVPLMPLGKLFYWAEQKVPQDAIARLLVVMVSDSSFEWSAFERFHACWEALRCCLETPGTKNGLFEHYRLSSTIDFRVSDTSLGRIRFKYCGAHETIISGDPFSSSLAEEGVPSRPTVLVSGLNPGYDIEVLRELDEVTHSGQRPPALALLVETKFSGEEAKTSVSKSEIEKKARGCVDRLMTKDGKRWCKENNVTKVVLVVVACRKVCRNALSPETKGEIIELRDKLCSAISKITQFGVIVLSRGSLKDVYGQTLNSRVQFLAETANKKAGYQGSEDDIE